MTIPVVNQLWSLVTSSFSTLAETWGQFQLPPITNPVDNFGYNIAMGEIPHVEILPYEIPETKRKKKLIELTCVVGTEQFILKKDRLDENRTYFSVKRIKFEIESPSDARLTVTTI
jgi:hypothetical protein